ncbi:MAG: TCP-1/cpn60 chaperonin family protein [Candidatus Diapherotrites archaeon]|nr:TCP-1/cpn60 chaperonin family protein [Candidatus Diapherotrites archaeon]
MTQEVPNQQVVFLGDGSKRVLGRDAQRINILIAKAVANAVKSTLGPKGMDKMIVDELGDVTISNDGATILSEMSIEHPAGKMLVDIAKSQDEEVGDGTTTVVVLAGGLLTKAEKLLDEGIHPSIIIKGYRLASKKAVDYYEEISDVIEADDKKTLRDIALTSMTGKAAESAEELSDLVVKAVSMVAEKEGDKTVIDADMIKLEKKTGASLNETQLFSGIVIDKEIVHSGMPRKLEKAKIALIDSALEIKSPETDTKIQINDPSQLEAFLDQEERMLQKMVSRIKDSGANVVFCQKGIDDMAQHFLAQEGIMAIRRVKKSDMEALAKATGAKLVSRLEGLNSKDLGSAGEVYSKKIAGDDMVFVEKCKNPKAVTILIRGGSEHITNEAERALVDAIGSTTTALKYGKIVSGGGSCEIEVSMKLFNYAKTVGGREQLAIEAFAETLEIIPRTLAETAGMDAIDAIVELRSKHQGGKGKYMGIDVFKAKVMDMKAAKVIEPVKVKTQAITSATEVSEMLLRIDDIIAGTTKRPSMPPGGMDGMGGMGGMGM